MSSSTDTTTRIKGSWEYDGVDINSLKSLTVLLDTLVAVAPFDMEDHLGCVTGYSFTERTILVVTRKPGQDVTYGRASTSLIALTSRVIASLNSFGEMDFQLWCSGVAFKSY